MKWQEKASTGRLHLREWEGGSPLVPLVTTAGLLRLAPAYELAPSKGAVLAPTDTGWDRYVALAPALAASNGNVTWTSLNKVARAWWGRNFPTGILPKEDGT